jgi:hypothetical protein
MIRFGEEIVSKQAVETSHILNVRNGTVNNMVDVRACNKPVERVSLMNLFVKYMNFGRYESRRVLPSRRRDRSGCVNSDTLLCVVVIQLATWIIV